MPTSVGPNTFGEENLVFGYDLGDTVNSYKGEPTVNYAPVSFGSWGTENTAQRIATGNTYQGQPTYNCTTTVGASWQGIDTTITGLRTAAGSSGTVTMSCMVRNNNPSSYPMYAYIGHDFSSTRNIPANSDWQKVQWTVNQSSMNNDYVEFRPYTNNANIYLEMTMPMVEVNKGHATQFTTGTRSATQGLIDLKGTSTIDLTNVSFDSNAQMTFDGTNDKVELSEYLTNIDTSVLSLEFVFRTNIGTGTYQPLLGWHYGRVGHGYVCLGNFTGHWGNESISFYNEGTGATPLSFAYTNGHSFLGDTNYHHAVIVLQTGNYQIFVDGEEITVNASFRNGSQSTVMQSNLFGYGTGPKVGIGVGSQTEGYFNGRIPITKIYNRALTAQEIRSNFNAIKAALASKSYGSKTRIRKDSRNGCISICIRYR